MKKSMIKENMAGIIFIALVMMIMIFWCVRKSDFFIDEIYTYGLSNSYYAPFLGDILKDGSQILTRDDLYDYLTVSGDDAFQFGSVYYNQTQDTQPPLHYFFMHFFSSIVKGSYSKWIGLSINIVLYFLTLLVLYNMGICILKSKKASALALLFYGLSYGGLSTALMIRMYLLMTFLTVCFAYIVLKLMLGEERKRYFIGAAVLLFLGLMTQYFFVVFAFFFSAVFCLRELKLGHIKRVLLYAVCSFSAIFLFYAAYPSVVTHLFADKLVSGRTAVSNMTDASGMGLSIYSFVMQTLSSYKTLVVAVGVVCLIGILRIKRIVKEYLKNYSETDTVLILLAVSTVLTLILIAVISPVTALRYVYNILPFIAIVGVGIVQIVWSHGWINRSSNIFLLFSAVLCICVGLAVQPMYVENISKEDFQIIGKYTNLPCVFFDKTYDTYRSRPAISQVAMELIGFEEVFVTDDFTGKQAEKYLENKNLEDGIVLYVGTYDGLGEDDCENVLDTISENTGFTYEFLTSSGYSKIYRLY